MGTEYGKIVEEYGKMSQTMYIIFDHHINYIIFFLNKSTLNVCIFLEVDNLMYT